MRTLFTSIGFAIFTMLLVSVLLLPAQPVRSAPPRPLALTQTAEPPTLTPTQTATATNTPTATSTPTSTPIVPTVTPTVFVTLTPTLIPTVDATTRPTSSPTVPPRNDPGGNPEVADPYVTKRANLDTVQVGDFVEFTLTVGNNGPGPATDVVVRDPVPAFLTIYNATTTRGLISVSGNTVTIEIGTVAPGEIITIVIRTRVNQHVTPPDNLNTATLSSSSPDANLNNNVSTVGVTTRAMPTATPTPGNPSSPSPSAPPQTTPTNPSAPAVTTSPVPPVTVATPRPTATVPVQLPPTGAKGTSEKRILMLLALSAVVAGAALRRRSVR